MYQLIFQTHCIILCNLVFFVTLTPFILVLELASAIQNRQNHLNKLMRCLLVHEETFMQASDIIHSVLYMKKSRPVLNGKQILSQFPIEFIERYQNIHSVIFLKFNFGRNCFENE